MTELLAYRGPWSFKLIALMLPRAVELEAKAADMNFTATLAAVGTLFSAEAATTWRAAMEKTRRSVDAAVADAGGVDKTKENEQKVVDDFLKVASKLTGASKEKGSLGPTGPTRVHKK